MVIREKSALDQTPSEAAVTEYIRTRGVTRCPTACVLPTQGQVAPSDRAALAEYTAARDRARQERASRRSAFFTFSVFRPLDC